MWGDHKPALPREDLSWKPISVTHQLSDLKQVHQPLGVSSSVSSSIKWVSESTLPDVLTGFYEEDSDFPICKMGVTACEGVKNLRSYLQPVSP